MKYFTSVDSIIKRIDWKRQFSIAKYRIGKKVNIKHDIESMAHECVVDVYFEIKKNGLKKSINSLLNMIASRKIVDHYRNKKNYVEINDETIPRSVNLDIEEWNDVEDKIARFDSPEKAFEKVEKIALFKLFLEELEPNYRNVLKLANNDYSDKEIAQQLKENDSTIRTWKLRGIIEARAKIRKVQTKLKDYFYLNVPFDQEEF